MLYKNTASQKIAVFAYTASTGAAKTGDAAQITAYLSKDWGAAAAVTDTNPTELDATNMPGWYVFDLTQAETNGNVLVFAPKSSTSGVVCDQVQVFTTASIDQTGDSYAVVNDGTFGLSALETLVDDLESRLTATRAGYLDNLSAGAVALEATLTAIKGGSWSTETLKAIYDQVLLRLLTSGYTAPDNASITAIKAKTDNLPSDPADESALEAAITAATSPLATAASVAALNNLSAAQVNAEVVDALTVDVIADSVATDGNRPTIAQALLELTRFLMERSVSSTTMTVKKEDGTTTSMTFTLDSATAPTAISRAS